LAKLRMYGKIMRMKKVIREMKRRIRTFRLQWRPMGYTLLVMLGATALSALLNESFIHNNNVSMIYALAVVVVSCITPGYFYGVLASLISVIGVNYFFTLPFWALNFSLTGYPITFLTLLVASVITSTLVTGYRERDRARYEAEAEKLRANLFRSISHDIRTPLTSISGASFTLLESGASIGQEESRALLTDIHENAQWLIRMVENLLTVTRIHGGGKLLQKAPEMAEEVVAQAVSQVRRRFPAQVINVSAEGEPVLIPMDGTLVCQVLINLMENAIFHSGSTAPIAVCAVTDGSRAIFTVQDSGNGIDEARIRRLLDGHIDASGAGDNARGMGIGLSICAAIVKAHSGEISACNADGGGAVFSFSLPL